MMNVAKDKIHNIYSPKRFDNKVSFDKNELGKILNIYGKMVALGEWRDYGISILRDFSIFSIYRHRCSASCNRANRCSGTVPS